MIIETESGKSWTFDGAFSGAYKALETKKMSTAAIAAALLEPELNPGLAEVDFFIWRDDDFIADMPAYRVDGGVVKNITEDKMLSVLCHETGRSKTEAKELWFLMKDVMHSKGGRWARAKADVMPLGFSDSAGLFWRKLSISEAEINDKPVQLEDIPEFAEFLSLMASDEDRKAFTLFCGSIFDSKSSRYQYLSLVGSGGEGKSVFTEALKRLLGDASSCSIRASDINGQHFGSILEGKRLVLFEDENSPAFVKSGAFERMTGEDSLTVEDKYKQPRSIKTGFKVLITSNNQIEIGSDASASPTASAIL